MANKSIWSTFNQTLTLSYAYLWVCISSAVQAPPLTFSRPLFAPPLAGSERSPETLEPTADAVCRHVCQRRLLPLGLLRGVVADRGPPLLQHRKPHRAHERQELLRHIQIGQPLCVKLSRFIAHFGFFCISSQGILRTNRVKFFIFRAKRKKRKEKNCILHFGWVSRRTVRTKKYSNIPWMGKRLSVCCVSLRNRFFSVLRGYNFKEDVSRRYNLAKKKGWYLYF